MMGPGFFGKAMAEDFARVAFYAFAVGVAVGMTIIVGVVFVVS